MISKFFYPHKDINQEKINKLYNKALVLRMFKNEVSKYYYEYLLNYLDFKDLKINVVLGEFSKINNLNKYIDNEIKINGIDKYTTNKDREYAIKQVNTQYINKVANIKNATKFKIIYFKNTFYKKNVSTKSKKLIHKKGDIKERLKSSKQTQLTRILNYMLHSPEKTYNEWLEYCSTIKNVKISKKDTVFFKDFEYILKKYNIRILKLIKLKKQNIINKFWKQRLEFKSLSYKTQNRTKIDMVHVNNNYNSSINGFINLGTYENNGLFIPTKLNSEYHFNTTKKLTKLSLEDIGLRKVLKTEKTCNIKTKKIDKYTEQKVYSGKYYTDTYNITFNKDNETFKRIELICEEEIDIDTIKNIELNQSKTIGLDINTKHNMYYLSNKIEYDYRRDLINDYVKYQKKIDKNKDNPSSFLKNKLNKISNQLRYNIIKTTSIMIQDMKEKGFNHLVIENINITGKKFRVKNKESDISYGRLFSFVNISSLKHIIKSIAHHHNIKVTIIPSQYTSQKCSNKNCNHIDRNNRKEQETFLCEKCNNELNADYNSALNISSFIFEEVLQNNLLTIDTSFNEFSPKDFISNDFIKKQYLKLVH